MNFRQVLVIVSVFAPIVSVGATFDPPDVDLESELHRQFLTHQHTDNAVSESFQGWLENYRIQQGENLWGLSQMLYGDGNYWPKVWAQNQSITNPHLVRKGHTLQFLMGSDDDAPSFRFSEAEEAGLELVAAEGGGTPQVQLPPPSFEPRPVLKLPGSFPAWQEVFSRKKDEIDSDLSHLHRVNRDGSQKRLVDGYVQDERIESVGKFLEVERESGLPVAMQYIYVKIKKGQGHIGKKFLMVKDHGLLKRLNPQVEDDINARYIQVYGDLEITEAAHGLKKAADSDFEIYRALLIHVIDLSLTDFDLIPGAVETVSSVPTGTSGNVTGQVLGSSKNYASELYGIGDLVFINKGSQNGVKVGQMLDIYIDRTIRDPLTPLNYANVSSGSLKIVKVSSSCATAVILTAVDSIQQGDQVRAYVAHSEVGVSGDAPLESKIEKPTEMDSSELPPLEENSLDSPASDSSGNELNLSD